MRKATSNNSDGGEIFSIILSSNEQKDVAKLRYIFEDIGPKCYSTCDLTKIVIMMFEDARNSMEQYAEEEPDKGDVFVLPVECAITRG